MPCWLQAYSQLPSPECPNTSSRLHVFLCCWKTSSGSVWTWLVNCCMRERPLAHSGMGFLGSSPSLLSASLSSPLQHKLTTVCHYCLPPKVSMNTCQGIHALSLLACSNKHKSSLAEQPGQVAIMICSAMSCPHLLKFKEVKAHHAK